MLRKGHILAILVIGVSITTVFSIQAQEEYSIPSWIKNTALWWGQGDITDSDFVSAMKFLIEEKVIQISATPDEGDMQVLEKDVLRLTKENQRLQDVADEHYEWYTESFDSNQQNLQYIYELEANNAKLYDAYLILYNLATGSSGGNYEYQPPPSTKSTSPPPKAAPPETQPSCDPSYPDVCIPPYPPDLDCGEILYANFRVVGSDPHGFDRDNDGIGCES